MIISIGSDHGGFDYKQRLIEDLKNEGHTIIDNGTYSKESCNYAEFALKTAFQVSNKKADFGILICNSGEGVSITANKVKGIRCALLYNDEVAHLAKEHNNANMIAFGANYMSYEDVLKRVNIFIGSRFEGGRHERRVQTIIDFENK